MKKSLVIFILIGFCITVLCSQAGAAAIRLRYVDHNPEAGATTVKGTTPLLESIVEATNGAVEIKTYYGETLMKARDTWDGLKNNLADIGWMALSYWPGRTPMTDAFGLPGLPYDNAPDYAEAMWNAYEKYPEMQQEYASGGIRPLIFFSSDPYSVWTTKKQVKVMEDLEGMKIRVLGGAPTTQMKALGGTPVSIPMPDNYISLQKGVIDGAALADEALVVWRFYEVLKYRTYAPLPVAYFTICVGEKQWQKLPQEIQEQIMSVCGNEGSRRYSAEGFSSFSEELSDAMAKGGYSIETYTLPEEERERWIKTSQPAFDDYMKFAIDRGVGESAQKLVNDLMNKAL